MSQRLFSVKVSERDLQRIEAAAAEAGLTRHGFVREPSTPRLLGASQRWIPTDASPE